MCTCIISLLFLLQNNILLYGYTTFCLSSPQFMDIWIVFTFQPLLITLLWMLLYKLLSRHLFSSLLDIYISKNRIAGSYGNSIFTVWEETANCFPKWLHHFTTTPAMYEDSKTSISIPTFIMFFLTSATLVGVSGILLWYWFTFRWC